MVLAHPESIRHIKISSHRYLTLKILERGDVNFECMEKFTLISIYNLPCLGDKLDIKINKQ